MEKLKQRWGLKTNLDVIAVFILFAINGSFAAYIGKPLFKFLNFSYDNNGWIYYPVKYLLVFIIYQITFPIVGWFLGQYKFARNFEKKFLSRLGLGFIFKNNTKP